MAFEDSSSKFYDSHRNGALILSSGSCIGGMLSPSGSNCLNAVPQGNGSQDREGNMITITRLTVLGFIARQNASYPVILLNTPERAMMATIWIILDTQANGAQALSQNVLSNSGGSTDTCPLALENIASQPRYKILWKDTKRMKADSVTFDVAGEAYYEVGTTKAWSFDANVNIPVRFKGTSESITSVVDNALHVIAFADVEDYLELSYNARIEFNNI